MTLRTVPGTDVAYHLVLFDKNGVERADPSGEKASKPLLEEASRDVTDVFVLSHGWKGDIPAAIAQYDAWVGAMAARQDSRARIRELVPGFKALLVAVHWPSLPWGVEDVDATLLAVDEGTDELDAEDELPAEDLVDLYSDRIVDTPAARDALTRIVAAAQAPDAEPGAAAGAIDDDLRADYETLFREAGLRAEGSQAAPGGDLPVFDPQATIDDWRIALGAGEAEEEDLTLGWTDDVQDGLAKLKKKLVLGPVRQMSFWTMKRRARAVGESGVHDLLRRVQDAAPDVRVHLMGHSFGCIVVSAAVAGPAGGSGLVLPRPVDAVFLVQGAMSLWSYAADVPYPPFAAGYFRRVLDSPAAIRGPIVTTRSRHDTAVGKYYPLGARITDDLLLDEAYPEFGGIGTFGIQGASAKSEVVLPVPEDYDLAPGTIYNVEASEVIANGSGASGAHSDIAHPEIAHLMWQAVIASAAQP